MPHGKAVGVSNSIAGLHGQKNIVGVGVFAVNVMRVLSGYQGNASVSGKLDQTGSDQILVFSIEALLDFQQIISLMLLPLLLPLEEERHSQSVFEHLRCFRQI